MKGSQNSTPNKERNLNFRTTQENNNFPSNCEQSQKDLAMRLQKENVNLRSSLKELQQKMNLLANNENDEGYQQIRLKEKNEKIQQLTQYTNALEEELEGCQKNLNFMQDALKQQIVGYSDDFDELVGELDQIEDPYAIVIINKLLTSNSRINRTNKTSFTSKFDDAENTGVNKAFQDYQKKVKKLLYEKKQMMAENDTLKTQNDFLTNQLNFVQKKLAHSNKKAYSMNTLPPNSDDLQSAICVMFGIRDSSKLIENLKRIQKAFEFLPTLQKTVEQIYQIVCDRSCIPVVCNSHDQLIEIIENWASNLNDYQDLVSELFNILKINEEDQKNRTHLIQSIRKLACDSSSINNYDHNEKGPEVISELKNLKKKVSAIDFFIEEARKKLNLDDDYSNEALFVKVLKFVDMPQIYRTGLNKF